jgi:dUTP pyrophosphatase
MAVFNPNILGELLFIYDKVMLLKIFVDDNDTELYDKYCEAAHNHNNKIINNSSIIDAGFDLYAPTDNQYEHNVLYKLDYKICCSAKMATKSNHVFNTGFYMYPRSSISKTSMRLANSTGIIDAGYRGHLMSMFDIYETNGCCGYSSLKFDRHMQICAPGLVPILVEIVQSMEELGEKTERGSGGFGSTGV